MARKRGKKGVQAGATQSAAMSQAATTVARAPRPDEPGRHRQGMGLVVGADQIARARSLHDWLKDRKLIDQTEHDAAERYREDYEIAHGARGGDGGGASAAGWERTPGQAQINAISRLRRANEVLGLDLGLVVAAVVRGESLRMLAVRFGGAGGKPGWSDGRTGKKIGRRMKTALMALEVHYFGGKGRSQPLSESEKISLDAVAANNAEIRHASGTCALAFSTIASEPT